MTTSGYLPHSAGNLIAELAAEAPRVGANTGPWPGLTIYRFTTPVVPSGEEIQSAAVSATDVAVHTRTVRERFLAGLLDAASGNGSAQAS